jgi:hypothetical protein
MSYTEVEYLESERDHAIAVARAKVQDWDLSMPHLLLEHLDFLREYVEQVAARAYR